MFNVPVCLKLRNGRSLTYKKILALHTFITATVKMYEMVIKN